MNKKDFTTANLSRRIDEIVGLVQVFFREQRGETFDGRLIEDGMRAVVAARLERLGDDMLEMFTSPERPEFRDLVAYIEPRLPVARAVAEVEEMVAVAEEFGDESVFEGYRPFSKAKMAAMIEYLSAKGNFVYKTSLNKLLFYSDLTHFYLRGIGMSGAVYYHRPFGPVADPAEPVLSELIDSGRINVLERTRSFATADGVDTTELSGEEKKVLDWVADTYGKMGASEISDLSHREMAYKFTQPNEAIAYGYGKFLKKLPPRELLDQ